METITLSGAAALTFLGLVWQFAKVKADHAARLATMEQRILSLEARAKHVDHSLAERGELGADAVEARVGVLRAGLQADDALLHRRHTRGMVGFNASDLPEETEHGTDRGAADRDAVHDCSYRIAR